MGKKVKYLRMPWTLLETELEKKNEAKIGQKLCVIDWFV